MILNRRQLAAAALASGALLPFAIPTVRAATTTPAQRKLVVIYCFGGWDPTWVFTSTLGHPTFYFDETASAEYGAGGIPYVHSPERPAVKAFFDAWGDRAAILNGMQVRALTHPSGLKQLFTDSATPGVPDWFATIAGASTELELPMVVSSGPVFTGEFGPQIMRLGESGQLSALISGEALDSSEMPTQALSESAVDSVDAYLAGRAAGLESDSWMEDYATGLERLHRVNALGDQIDLGLDYAANISVADRMAPALDCLELGLSRVVTVAHPGFRAGWDHHSAIGQHNRHLQYLFSDVKDVVDSLAARPGSSGGTLLDETTVLVCSEMGRAPLLNGAGGKDHWIWTSALLVGSGIKGGQVVGLFNEDFEGEPLNSAGEPDAAGVIQDAGHLGATLFELTGVEKPAHIQHKAPIEALLA